MRKFLLAGLASMALAGFGSPSTADFVQKAAMSDMYEVQAGKLATEKGQSDAVKQGQSPRWTAKQAAWPG